MPNTFITLDVPRGEGAGTPAVVATTGHPKTFVLAGDVAGARYVVEGSNDGGGTWDILIDDDGTQTLFTTNNAGTKSVDCIVEQVRVRRIGGASSGPPPSLTMGAPPSVGPSFFGRLEVPQQPGLGAPLDLGLGVGPLKTFILRGPIAAGSRFTVLASMDGVQFDELLQFTADQQGARSRQVMCRYLRVLHGGAFGPTPAISVGGEGLAAGTGGGGEPGPTSVDLTLSDSEDHATTEIGREELLAQFSAPVAQLPFEAYTATLSGLSRRADGAGGVSRFRVRFGGHAGEPDGTEVLVLEDGAPGVKILGLRSAPFPRPTTNAMLVKVTAEAAGDAPGPARLGSITVFFRPVSGG